MESQEIAKRGTSEVGHVIPQAYGTKNLGAEDILMPKLLLMQGQSELVLEGTKAAGEIIKSTTGETVAKKGDWLKFAPLYFSKVWRIMEKEKDKFVFRRYEDFLESEKGRPWEWVEGGTDWRADKCMNFYVLLIDDLARNQKNIELAKKGKLPVGDMLVPALLQFTRTSFQGGKKLATHFARAAQFNLPPYMWEMKVSSKMQKNDQGTYAVYEVDDSGATADNTHEVCSMWCNRIEAGNVRSHEAETEGIGRSEPAVSPEDKF